MCTSWYHLSKDDSLTRILPSSFKNAEFVITPRIPEACHGEHQTIPRVCVAPTIWQCVLPVPRSGKLFIYRLSARSVTPPKGGIADLETSDERWITDDNIMEEGGEIPLALLGFINKTEELAVRLKILNKRNALPRDPVKAQSIWNIKGNQYELRDELVI